MLDFMCVYTIPMPVQLLPLPPKPPSASSWAPHLDPAYPTHFLSFPFPAFFHLPYSSSQGLKATWYYVNVLVLNITAGGHYQFGYFTQFFKLAPNYRDSATHLLVDDFGQVEVTALSTLAIL